MQLTTHANTFLERRSDGIRTDIADLQGIRFVSAVESKPGRRLDETLVKGLTGDDTMRGRHLYQEAFSFKPQCTIWLATNHKPEIVEQTPAMWRRIRLVPFAVCIPPERQNPDLPAKLRAELDGIFAWAVAGCLEWRQSGLGQVEEVEQATTAYREKEDVLAGFMETECVTEPGAKVGASVLYSAYKRWCAAQGEKEVSQKTFGGMLTERGFARKRGAGGRYEYQGLGLIADGPSDGSEGSEAKNRKSPYIAPRDEFPENGSLHSLHSFPSYTPSCVDGLPGPSPSSLLDEVEVVL